MDQKLVNFVRGENHPFLKTFSLVTRGTRSASSTLCACSCCTCTCVHSNTTNLALLEAHRELTAEEMLLSVLLKVSGRPLVLGALDRRSPRRPPPDGASLAWWKVPYRATVPT